MKLRWPGVAFVLASGAATLGVALPSGAHGVGDCRLIGTPGDDNLDLTGCPYEAALANGGGYVDGRGGDDLIIGSDFADYLVGGPGNDQIIDSDPGSGNANVRAGAGRDLVVTSTAIDYIRGGTGSDSGTVRWRVGTPDESTFTAGLFGGAAGDEINGGRGRDKCRGGPGRDRLRKCERR